MRDPFSDDRTASDSSTARGGATRSRGVATRGLKPGQAKTSAKARSARPRLPRVPGGKARARLHLFEQQREIEETDVKRKKPDKPSAKLRSRSAVMTRSARSRSRGPNADSASPYLRAFVHKRDLDITAPASPVEQGWRPIGPFSIPHGQSYGRGAGSRPPVAGRIVTIAVDPGNASHILIGSGGGGVWETKDTGKTWHPRTDDQPSMSTGAIAFDPTNPLIVYVGTGEGDSVSALGVGILKSTDGGTTWSLHAREPFEGIGFYELVVDPLNGNHILAATTAGLFESTNGGAAWTQRRAQVTWDLSIHPANSADPGSTKEIFAACKDGLFRSTNGGTSWSPVSLPGASSQRDRIEVCHAPSDGNVVYVWAAGNPQVADPGDPGSTMPKPSLWRRNVFGGPFTPATPPPDVQTSQAWYDWFLGVAPNNPDVLYVGAINVHRGIRSASGTWAWTNIGAKISGDSVHPDQHAIAFSPTDPSTVYVGNDGGIYRSPDAGITWQPLNKGLNITEFEFLAQHPQFENWLIGGTQDNGTVRYEGEEVWYHVEDGDGGDCGTNATNPYTCYSTFYGMGMQRSTRGGGWGTWTWVGPNVPNADNYPDGSLFYPPVEVCGRTVVQAGRKVYISADGGTNWRSVALPAVAGLASSMVVPNPSRIYVGTDSGRVYRLDLVGTTWSTPVSLGRPSAGFVSDVLVDQTNPNRLWITYSSVGAGVGGAVFRSDNAGASWQDVTNGLPDIALNSVEIDPLNPDTVYVAADVGVYRSTNAGAVWTSFNNKLPNVLVKDLAFHPRSRLLRAATQSRGVWEIAIDQAMMPSVDIYLRDSTVDSGRSSPSASGVPDPFSFGSQTFWWQCQDIKVDSPSFQTPLASDVDFQFFEDDHGVFASGLKHENPQRNRTVRVFVQLHNRGINPAANVAVKIFFAEAAVALPNLPTSFWNGFPNNVLPNNSPWKQIGPHRIVESVDGGSAKIVAFDWTVPPTAPNNISLLAIITADNDSLSTSELNIAALVKDNKKCGLKNMVIVNPSPIAGPAVRSLRLDVGRTANSTEFSLATDRAATSMIRSVVLSKPLSALAKKARVKQVKLSNADKDELARLMLETPELKKLLDTKTAFATSDGVWLENVTLKGKTPQPIVVLLNSESPRNRSGSIIQSTSDGTIVGGFTFQANDNS
ncbi:MAG TPA: hypothetical protein VEW46_23940 [Pyrinomonadaceae bacterium]|nr:hypothetical protein [Pyrinomonadaceae bacterium]